MECGKMWSRKFLFDTMNHTVYKRMIDKSTMVEVQRQKAMLASTIPLVEMGREHDAAEKNAAKLELQIADLAIRARNWRNVAENLQTDMNNFARGRPLTHVTKATKPSRLFLCRCSKNSNNEECRGFVDSETHMCAVCDTKHCARCLEELGKDHQCNEDVIQNVKALRATCKPCPKCFAPIHKIYGCNDMFCVACATAFCWRTMKIHQNGNSNPHYYQWLRDSEQSSSSNLTGRFYDRNFMASVYYRTLPYNDKEKIAKILQKLAHQRQKITSVIDRHNTQNRQMKNTLERAAYLKNDIDDAEFKKRIKRIQTDVEHAEMIGDTLSLIQKARTLIVQLNTDSTVDSIIADVTKISHEYNERHVQIGKIFSRKPFSTLTIDS